LGIGIRNWELGIGKWGFGIREKFFKKKLLIDRSFLQSALNFRECGRFEHYVFIKMRNRTRAKKKVRTS
jgi:hypothetical protein